MDRLGEQADLLPSISESARVRQIVLDQFNCAEVFLCEFSPLSVLIVGLGLVGLDFYPE